MGFLFWQPQLLSELWDRVSSENNRSPLKKKTLRTWQLAGARPCREGSGRLVLAKMVTKTRPFSIAPLRRAAQLDNGLDTDEGTPM